MFPIGGIVNGGCTTDLSPDVIARTTRPSPTRPTRPAHASSRRSSPRAPTILPASDQLTAWKVLGEFDRAGLSAFSDHDPVTEGGERGVLRGVPGTEGQPHVTIEGAGHFLQEDRGTELATVIADFIAATSPT